LAFNSLSFFTAYLARSAFFLPYTPKNAAFFARVPYRATAATPTQAHTNMTRARPNLSSYAARGTSIQLSRNTVWTRDRLLPRVRALPSGSSLPL